MNGKSSDNNGPPAGMDFEEFRKRGYETVDRIVDYYKNIENFPVLSNVQPGYLKELLPENAPDEPEPFNLIQDDVEKFIMPGVTHWQHPNFFAYFPANSSFPGILGDMYSSMINCIGFNWICSPACTELETIVLDWLAKLLKLPAQFMSDGKGGGVIQGTASEAVIVAVLAARTKSVNQHIAHGRERFEICSKLVAYCSDQTHSSVAKACQIANVQLKKIKTNHLFALTGNALKAQIEADKADGLIPFFVCGTVGTTSSGAIDALADIGSVANENGLWFHVDAAWAGAACICEEYRPFLDGVELADSFNMNLHKWLLVNFDCSPLWVKNRSHLLDALSITAPYYRNPATESGLVSDYRDWQIPLGRRFRSLKVWFVVRTYGVKGLQSHIRKHVHLAEQFSEKITSPSSPFELFVPRTLSLLVIRLRDSSNEENKKLCDAICARGFYLTGTELNGASVMRIVSGSPWVQEKNFEKLWDVLVEESQKIIQSRLN